MSPPCCRKFNRRNKRLAGILCAVVAVAVMVATVPMFTSHAASDGSCGENATYTLDDSGVLTITGTGEIRQYAFAGRTAITSAEIGSGITGIGNNAFMNCSIMTSVTIPGGVTTIGDAAFQSCSSLVSVNIPGSVTSIGNVAFQGCGCLNSVTIENGVTSIGQAAFYGCYKLTSVTIPSSVTTIDNAAFMDCTSLGTLTFKGTSLTNSAAFSYLSSNQTVKIPNGFTFNGEEITTGDTGNSTTYFGQATVEFYDSTPTTTTTTTTTTAKPTTATTATTAKPTTTTAAAIVTTTTTTAPLETLDIEGEPRNGSNLLGIIIVSIGGAVVSVLLIFLVATGKMKGILTVIKTSINPSRSKQ